MAQQIHSGTRTAPSAGVAVRLSSSKLEARWAIIQALGTNTGVVYIRGISEDGGTEIQPAGSLTLPMMTEVAYYNLKEIHLVAAVAGEGVSLLWYAGKE